MSFALCGVVLMPLVGCAQPAGPASATDISQTLARYVSGKPGVGVIVGVVDRGSVLTYAAGSLGPKGPTLDARTEFQIGSVTKTFTATLLAAMVRAGEVRLGDPIARYLPPGVTAPTFHGQAITLRNLAEQNSGLPPLPANLGLHRDPYKKYTRAQLYAFLSHYALKRAPGAQYEYSNLGVGLLGDLLAARAHTSYAALLERRVLQPLGLDATGVDPTPNMLARLAPGRNAPYGTSEIWHFGELAACGALYSNLSDMLRYLQDNLAAPKGALGTAMAFAQRPRAPAPNGMRIGLVWNTIPTLGVTWHNGEVGGYHSFIGFNREAGYGVVVLANDADFGVDTVAMHILAPSAFPTPAPLSSASPGREDASVTARVKALYQSYIRGNVDTSQMTPDFAKLFTPAFVAQLRAGTDQLGAPTSWMFAGSATGGGITRYDYRVAFASGSQTFSVWITDDGKISGSRLSP